MLGPVACAAARTPPSLGVAEAEPAATGPDLIRSLSTRALSAVRACACTRACAYACVCTCVCARALRRRRRTRSGTWPCLPCTCAARRTRPSSAHGGSRTLQVVGPALLSLALPHLAVSPSLCFSRSLLLSHSIPSSLTLSLRSLSLLRALSLSLAVEGQDVPLRTPTSDVASLARSHTCSPSRALSPSLPLSRTHTH